MQITTILTAALVLLCVLVVGVVLAKAKRRPTSTYELLPGLLSQAERSFYRALHAAVSDHYLIVPKVRVADVLKVAVTAQRKGRTGAFNRIAMKHFDFVLCDPRTLSFIGAVELDDKSHQRRDRVVRDMFLRNAASDAKLPLHRFQAKATYVVAEIRDALLPRAAETELARLRVDGRIEPIL